MAGICNGVGGEVGDQMKTILRIIGWVVLMYLVGVVIGLIVNSYR